MTEHWYVFYGLEYGKSKNFTIRFVCNKALTLNKENLLKKKINCSVGRNVSCGIILVIGAAKGMGSDID